MERLAREKIALQQRLSTLKKDMLGKWDHLDWRAISVPEDLDIDLETDAVITVDYGRKQNRKITSPVEGNKPPNTESENDEESNDSHYPVSLTMSNGHHGQWLAQFFCYIQNLLDYFS